jgi:hypothetical protein
LRPLTYLLRLNQGQDYMGLVREKAAEATIQPDGTPTRLACKVEVSVRIALPALPLITKAPLWSGPHF